MHLRAGRGCIGGLEGSYSLRGQKGYRWHQGHWELLGGVEGPSGGVGVYWGLAGSVGMQGTERV